MAEDKYILIYNKVLEVLEKERLFLNPDLSLRMLSRVIGTNTMYLSKAINQGFGESFNTVVNSYRIDYLVSEALRTGEDIEGVYIKHQFWSRSTFYDTFRRLKGTSPVKYMEEQKKKQHRRHEHSRDPAKGFIKVRSAT